MLLTVAELVAQLEDPRVVVCDCRHDLQAPERGEQSYREEHVPGARYVGTDTVLSGVKDGRNGRHPLPSPAEFVERLTKLGIGPEDHLVAYDDAGGLFAARLWWMARGVGLKASLLDGGWQAWKASGNRSSGKGQANLGANASGSGIGKEGGKKGQANHLAGERRRAGKAS